MSETVNIQEVRLDPVTAGAKQQIFDDVFALTADPKAIPEYEKFIASLSPDQQSALELVRQGIGSYQPLMDEARSALDESRLVARGSDAMYDPSMASGFRNEYTGEVVDAALRDIAEQGELQRRQLSTQALQQGAFGGARGAIEQGLQRGRELQSMGDTASRLRFQAEQEAQRQAQSAFEASKGRQQGLASLMGNIASGYGSQAVGLQNLMGTDINRLFTAGSLTQAQEQALMDAQLRSFQERANEPYGRLGFAADIVGGLPTGQSSYSSQTVAQDKPSLASQILGFTGAGYGFFGAPTNPFTYNPTNQKS